MTIAARKRRSDPKRRLFIVLVMLAVSHPMGAQKPTPTDSVLPTRSPTYPTPSPQQHDARISALLRDYEAAFNRGDAKAIAALYTSDAWRATPDGRLIVGQAAIQSDYEVAMAGPMKGAKGTLHHGKTRAISPDVSLVEGTYEVTMSSGTIKRRYLNTLIRQGEQWRLVSAVFIAELPPAIK
jgi:uncharacterized protein (TIGR02246 family)